MASLAEIRAKYPQYKDLSDQQLADGLYKKFYSDMPRDAFDQKLGIVAAPSVAPASQTSPVTATPQPNILQQVGQVASQTPMLAPFTQGIPAIAKTLGMDNSGRNPMDALATMGENTFSSVPIAGPALHNAGEQARAWVGKNIYGDQNSTPETALAADAARDKSYPEAAAMGDLAGPTAAFLLASRIPGAPVALGLEGSLGSRFGFGLGSQYGINVGDEVAHGKSLGDALINSVIPTAEAAPFFLFGGGKTTKPTIGPTSSELKADAGKIYDQARASGVEMPQSGTIALSDNMFQVARDAGIVSPTGQVAKGYGKIGDVLDHMDQYANGTMTVPQMQATRKLLQDAAGSIDKGERRVGTMMLKAFDNVVAQGVPQLGEAAPIYARGMRGAEVDKYIRRGERKGNYTTKMGQLSDRIAEGKSGGYSEAEKAAIEKASNPSLLSAALKGTGKLAAKTPVLNWALSPTIGAASSAGASMLDKRAADLASALIRRGGPAPLVDRTGIMASPFPNLLGRALLAQ